MREPIRQIGRTTKMLLAVLELATEEHSCVVIGSTQHHAGRLLGRFRQLADRARLVDEKKPSIQRAHMLNGATVHFMSRASWDYHSNGLGIEDGYVFWDHAAWYEEHIGIFKEYHRWD